MRANDPHGWARGRHIAATLGLLDDAELAAYREHLSGCPRCRAQAAEFAVEADEAIDTSGHVPPALLVAHARGRVAGGVTEAMALAAHLTVCASCREELRWLETRVLAVATAPAATKTSARRALGLQLWAASSTAVAAALAIALFQPRSVRVIANETHVRTPAAAALELIGAPETLRTPLRGNGAGGVPRITPGPRGELVLRFEPMDQPANVPMTLVVLGPDGRAIATIDCLQRDLELRHTLVLTPTGAPFASGRYDLAAIAHPGGAAPETLTLGFEVASPR